MISIIIVTYNAANFIRTCLESVIRTTTTDVEIIVVDNASVDNTAEVVMEFASDVLLVNAGRNLGFAAGCNMGVRASAGDTVLLLNPDTAVHDGCVEALHAELVAHRSVSIIGGRTLRPNGLLDPHSCWGLPSLWSLACYATGLSMAFRSSKIFDSESLGRWPRDSARQVGAVTGCLLMCARSTWDTLGGMDEHFFLYGEDLDFGARAARLSIASRITPHAVITHDSGSASSSSLSHWQMMSKGKVSYLRRNWPQSQATVGIWLLQMGVGLRAALNGMGLPTKGPWRQLWSTRAEWASGW